MGSGRTVALVPVSSLHHALVPPDHANMLLVMHIVTYGPIRYGHELFNQLKHDALFGSRISFQHSLQVDKKVAERRLREHHGDAVAALRSFLVV